MRVRPYLLPLLAAVAAAASADEPSIDGDRAPSADLALASSRWRRWICTGETLRYSLTVTNSGPDAADTVTTWQNLPAVIFSPIYTEVLPSQGYCWQQGANVLCDLGRIAAGGSATIAVGAVATDAGVASSVATIQSSSPPDPRPEDNTLTLPIRAVHCPARESH